jgi:1-phosphofructokinase family hexose kinase
LIIAAGLTPAWQQMLVFERFRVGEVNRAAEACWCASGKVLNVGLALHHLGGPNLTIALVGGASGESIERELAGLGMRHVSIAARRPTRACTTILDRSSGVTTELVENAAPVEGAELERFIDAYARAAAAASMVVLSGSLPPGAPATFYRALLERTPCRAVLDARGPELLEALPLKPFVVKPNREELGKTVGREIRGEEDLLWAVAEVHRHGAEWVVVSDGKGRLLASGGGAVRRFRPASVPTVNPIGCGDCLAAGIAWATVDGMAMPEAVRFGMAAAAENAAMLLPSRLDLEKVRRRMAEVGVED